MPLKKLYAIPVAIRALKTIIKCRGKDFSDLTGIPYQKLRDMECGRSPFSRDHAWQIRMATGVAVDSMLAPSKFPRGEGGYRYTKEDFIRWQTKFLDHNESPDKAWDIARNIGAWVGLLLLANQKSKRSTVHKINRDVGKCIDEIAKELRLGPEINRTLRQHPAVDTLTLTKEDWERTPEIARVYGVTPAHLKRVAAFEQYTGRVESEYIWAPDCGAPDFLLKALGISASTLPPQMASPVGGNS